MRQVTHALLTRPPLSHKIFNPEGNQIECFVRLACVKHAASVHPEPGSNSHVKKFCPARIKSGFSSETMFPIYCFKVASLIEAFLNYSQNLSRFFTVQLSMFVVVIFNSLYILSCLQVVVNSFFIFLCCRSFAATLISYHVCRFLSTTFFLGNLFCRSSISLGFIRSELLCTSQLCYNTTRLEFCQSEITN